MALINQLPKVKSAYVPSGKISRHTIPIMVVLGGLCSILAGYVFAWLAPRLFVWLVSGRFRNPIYEFLGRNLAAPFFAFMAGLIAGGIFLIPLVWIGRIAKNRNDRVGLIIGGISGIAMCLIFLFAYSPRSGGLSSMQIAAISPSSYINILKILICIGITLSSCLIGSASIASSPFCEKDEQYMRSKILGNFEFLSQEKLIQILNSRSFERIADLSETNKTDNHYSISMYYCDSCLDGIIEMKVHSTIKMRNESKTDVRLVFSSFLNSDETKGVLDTYGIKQAKSLIQ